MAAMMIMAATTRRRIAEAKSRAGKIESRRRRVLPW